MFLDGTEKAITTKRDHGKTREARAARFAGPERFRSSKVVVIWTPNQVFEKSERRGEIPQGRSPLRFSATRQSRPSIYDANCCRIYTGVPAKIPPP